MRFRNFLLISSLLGGFCQLTLALPPDFSANYHFTNRPGDPVDNVISFNAPGATNPINNSGNGCVGFSFTYNSEGFSVVSINLQTSPKFLGGQSSGTWSTFGGTATTGTLPLTGTSQGTYVGYGYYPFLRVNLATATGTGSIDVQFQCWKSISYASTMGASGGGGTITGNSVQAALWCLAASGSGITYTCSPINPPTSLATGQIFLFGIDTTNTGNSTLNINSLGAIAIKHKDGSQFAAGDLVAGDSIFLYYDGTEFVPLAEQLSNNPGVITLKDQSSDPSAPGTVGFTTLYTKAGVPWEVTNGGLPVPTGGFSDFQGNSAITGTGADAPIYSVTLPAGAIGAGKCFNWQILFKHSTGAATPTYRIKTGLTSTDLVANGDTSTWSWWGIWCNNPGSTSTQFLLLPPINYGFGGATYTIIAVSGGAGLANTTETTTNSLTFAITFNVAATDVVTRLFAKSWINP